jgi:hypothetical protein
MSTYTIESKIEKINVYQNHKFIGFRDVTYYLINNYSKKWNDYFLDLKIAKECAKVMNEKKNYPKSYDSHTESSTGFNIITKLNY